MVAQNYTPADIASRGQALYETKIRPHIDGGQFGKFAVIDIILGDYEIDDDDLAASDRVLARNPSGILYGARIGYPTAYRLGGTFIKSPAENA
jgi:hypothetical protein